MYSRFSASKRSKGVHGFRESRFQMFVRAARSVEQELDVAELLVKDPITHPRAQRLHPVVHKGRRRSQHAQQNEGKNRNRSRAAQAGMSPGPLACTFTNAWLRAVLHRQVIEKSAQVFGEVACPRISASRVESQTLGGQTHRGSRELEGRQNATKEVGGGRRS